MAITSSADCHGCGGPLVITGYAQTLVSCPQCGVSFVPSGATQVSLLTRTGDGSVLPGTRIELPGKDNQPVVFLRSYKNSPDLPSVFLVEAILTSLMMFYLVSSYG